MQDLSIYSLAGAIIVLSFCVVRSRREVLREEPIGWSNVSLKQLKLHHALTIAMADRVHLDPTCRDLLRHQYRVLKSIGVAEDRAEAPTSIELKAYGPRADGTPPLLKRESFPKSDLDEWNRSRGYKIYGDQEEEDVAEDGDQKEKTYF